jgi:hypothetical protein
MKFSSAVRNANNLETSELHCAVISSAFFFNVMGFVELAAIAL